ncbi:MAG: DmsC/YnfH family molybdoenzyme membrane anchor subunit [Hyphomicrobiales bacterium]
MHPALSVIFFTVTSGAGFGFMFVLGLGLPMPESRVAAFFISALAGGLAIAGLISSTFHLGHPERAWRAFSQWRSSWLSREGVLAVLALSCFGLYVLFWVFSGERILMLGLLVSVLSFATIFATAMIYAQLKTVPNWHTFWTPLCYLFFAIASGLLLAAAFTTSNSVSITTAAFVFVILSWAIKLKWWSRAAAVGFSDTGSDVGTATGLGKIGKVRLLEKPHSGENYLTKEMVHQIGRKHADKLRKLALIVGGVIPAILCLLVAFFGLPSLVLFLAFIAMAVGLFAERWLFFAEAKHAVSLYY